MLKKSNYHHGDLRPVLLETATTMLEQGGLDALSLRKIALEIGVSRTAAYHHFKDKHELLCAIAALGFERWQEEAKEIFSSQVTKEQQVRHFVFGYLSFATKNAHLYDLMFGRTLWKEQGSNQSLKDAAYPTFQFQVEMMKHWQTLGLLPNDHSALRTSQVIWGTLHGIAKLMIDGVYTEQSSIEDMCECAIDLFLQR